LTTTRPAHSVEFVNIFGMIPHVAQAQSHNSVISSDQSEYMQITLLAIDHH
jgi:hypothetical protein